MNSVYVITPLYNCERQFSVYLKSLYQSQLSSSGYAFDFKFIFVIDQPYGYSNYIDSIEYFFKLMAYEYKIIKNNDNLGVTRSRNIAAEYISKEISPGDYVMQFDGDDEWTKNSIDYLNESLSDKYFNADMLMYPIAPINEYCRGYMTLGQFCTYIPMQEAIYVWSYNYFKSLMNRYGNLYYEDENKCKLYPEAIRLLQDHDKSCFVDDSIICKAYPEEGNFTKNYRRSIYNNIPAFMKLAEEFRKLRDSNIYPISDELNTYINWISEYKVLDR